MGLLIFVYSLAGMRSSLRLKQDIIEEMQAKVEAPALDCSKVKVQTSSSNASNLIASLADARADYQKDLQRYRRRVKELQDGIALLPDRMQRIVLQGMYIHCDSYRTISEKLHMPEKEVTRIAMKAFDALDDLKAWS